MSIDNQTISTINPVEYPDSHRWFVERMLHQPWGQQLLDLIDGDLPAPDQVVQGEAPAEAAVAWLDAAAHQLELLQHAGADVAKVAEAADGLRWCVNCALVAAALDAVMPTEEHDAEELPLVQEHRADRTTSIAR